MDTPTYLLKHVLRTYLDMDYQPRRLKNKIIIQILSVLLWSANVLEKLETKLKNSMVHQMNLFFVSSSMNGQMILNLIIIKKGVVGCGLR